MTEPIYGLRIGLVRQAHDDPAGQSRIKVSVPMVDGGADGKWARIATGFGPAASGANALPEAGDEVLVAYIDGDPDFPVIVGGFNRVGGGSGAEPDPAAEEGEPVIRSRE